MADDTTTQTAVRPGVTLLCAAAAASGALASGAVVGALGPVARTGHGEQALVAGVLVGLALIGALLCLYLAVIWALAALVVMVGPASRSGAAVLAALRVLAPRLARRLSTGAVVATAATALVIAPGSAAESIPERTAGASGPASSVSVTEGGDHAIPQSSRLVSAQGPSTESDRDAASSDGTAGGPDAPRDDGDAAAEIDAPPSLGWGEETSPEPSDAPEAPEAPDAPEAPPPDPPRIVIVRSGDSLWSITEDLLGPAPSDPAEIAASWPQLHEMNRDLIGPDPDRLHPGQELTVPTSLTPQDTP